MTRRIAGWLGLLVLVSHTALLFGCRARRSANHSYMITGELSRTGENQRTTGGAVSASGQYAKSWENFSVYGRGELTLGSSSRLLVDLQVGLRTNSDNSFFARGGAFGSLSSRLRIIELPTLWFGFQHHSRTLSPGIHFDIGPRVSLASGRAASLDAERHFAWAPTVGASALAMGFGWSLEVTYVHIATSGSPEVLRFSTCAAYGVALCLETEHIIAPFDGERRVSHYIGMRLGVGLVTERLLRPL